MKLVKAATIIAISKLLSEINFTTTALNVYVIQLAKEALNLVALITNILLNICRNTLINDIKINKNKFILLSFKTNWRLSPV